MILDVTPEQRLEMCRLAFSFDPRIRVSDIEIRRGGKSYTVDTLSAFYGDDVKLSLLCGTDMMLTLDTWYNAARIFAMANIVWMRRETATESDLDEKIRQKIREYRERFHATIRELHSDPLPLSSTVCRKNLTHPDFISENLPISVREYIEKWHLYQ